MYSQSARRALVLGTLLVLLSASAPALGALPQAWQQDAGQPGDAPAIRDRARALPAPNLYKGELTPATGDRADFYAVDVPVGATFVEAVVSGADRVYLRMWQPDGSLHGFTPSGELYWPQRVQAWEPAPGRWLLAVDTDVTSHVPYSLRWTVDVGAPAGLSASPAPVVVATLDTGTNPYHPCFRRPGLDHPHDVLPKYPADSRPLELVFEDTFAASARASSSAMQSIEEGVLHHVPGTNLAFFGYGEMPYQILDLSDHGGLASSQIGCEKYGLAENAIIVVLNWHAAGRAGRDQDLLRWAAQQEWIDVIHYNRQDIPLLVAEYRAMESAIRSGKMVVMPAGNGVFNTGVAYPTEVSTMSGPPGSLVVGANDNGGYAWFSNLDPHVVMDGSSTVAADPRGFGEARFGGTSSSSPRVAGYVARLLGELRVRTDHTGEGLLTLPPDAPRPAIGPLTDGVLTAAELHEVIRKTADPNPHDSRYDGGIGVSWVPHLAPLPFALYSHVGYGEISEHTMPAAIAVTLGEQPMPERPFEDAWFAHSERLRHARWT